VPTYDLITGATGEAECKGAAAQLGASCTKGGWKDWQAGCFYNNGGKSLYYNTDTAGLKKGASCSQCQVRLLQTWHATPHTSLLLLLTPAPQHVTGRHLPPEGLRRRRHRDVQEVRGYRGGDEGEARLRHDVQAGQGPVRRRYTPTARVRLRLSFSSPLQH